MRGAGLLGCALTVAAPAAVGIVGAELSLAALARTGLTAGLDLAGSGRAALGLWSVALAGSAISARLVQGVWEVIGAVKGIR